jgi:hypothetical protein
MNRLRIIRRWPALAVVTLLAAAVPVLAPGAARADRPTAFGWWTSTNPGVPSAPVPGLVPASTTAPDIPPGGFEVANVPGDTSYAAIYYTSSETVTQVVLSLAGSAANAPNSTVQACPLTGAGVFEPAAGGTIGDAPPYDCSHPIAGTEDASAGTFSFPVASLAQGGTLAVAVVAGGTGRLVFNAPDASTVHVTPAFSESSGLPASNSSPSTSIGAPAAGTPPVPSDGASAASPAAPAVAPVVAPSQAAGQQRTLAAVTQPSGTTGAGGAVVGFVLVVLAAVAVLRRGRMLARAATPAMTGVEG